MGSGTKIHKIYRGASETPDPMEEQEVDGICILQGSGHQEWEEMAVDRNKWLQIVKVAQVHCDANKPKKIMSTECLIILVKSSLSYKCNM